MYQGLPLRVRAYLGIPLDLVWFGLVWFYGTSSIVVYLIPNPFSHILTVLFQTIPFSISTHFSSVWPIDRILSGATTPGQWGPRSDGNEGLLHILQSFRDEVSPPDGLISYPRHSLGEFYFSGEMLSVYFSVPVDLATSTRTQNVPGTTTRSQKYLVLPLGVRVYRWLPLRTRVDLKIMAKEYARVPRPPER